MNTCTHTGGASLGWIIHYRAGELEGSSVADSNCHRHTSRHLSHATFVHGSSQRTEREVRDSKHAWYQHYHTAILDRKTNNTPHSQHALHSTRRRDAPLRTELPPLLAAPLGRGTSPNALLLEAVNDEEG